MNRWMLNQLICPQCLPAQLALSADIREARAEDIVTGELTCPACGGRYPIQEGIAVVLPEQTRDGLDDQKGYNAPGMLSAYLWSHFGDLFDEPQATDAYRIWSTGFNKSGGNALDVGCAVGRLSFELTRSHHRVIGVDTSIAFIRKAREILSRRRLDFDLIVEGHLSEPRSCDFSPDYDFSRVEFIVADALALPFRRGDFATVAAINLLEKVPDPLKHLMEVNRVMGEHGSTFLFSDPFSWDEAVSPPELWLSGNGNAQYSPRGIDTIRRLFSGEYGIFSPPLTITADGNVAWKIRKTENLWEHITSQYLLGTRP
jgi:SAM-dependent methyltransferase